MVSALLKEIAADQSGATAVEYGLIVSLIVIAMIAALQDVASTTVGIWKDIERDGTEAMTQ